MKKSWLLLSILMVWLLAGCSGSAAEQGQSPLDAAGAVDGGIAAFVPQGGQNSAEATRLLFGTLMLEGSELAVTPEQASQLLPLWKLYRSLLESDITATAEIEAVAKQIGQSMTAEQLTTFENQEIDRTRMNELMQDLGVDLFAGAGDRPGGFSPPDGFIPGQGGGPGGEGGPGGRGPGGEAGIDPEIMATRQAIAAQGGGFQRGFNLPLVEALIDLLEQRVGQGQ